MRDDPIKPEDYAESDVWDEQRYSENLVIPNTGANGIWQSDQRRPDGRFKSNSLSGNERNRLFVRSGDDFIDLTLVSGADFMADGRGFAWTDFDQDGYLDMIVTSLDVPRIRFMRNMCGELGANAKALTVRLRGSSQSAEASSTMSNRDGIGAKIWMNYTNGDKELFQRQCGEGFSVQNSPLIRLAVSSERFPSSIVVQWPSGKITSVATDPENLKYLITEN